MITNLAQFKPVPAILGIILIDCWEFDKIITRDATNKFYHNLARTIQQRKDTYDLKCQINHAPDTFWDIDEVSVTNTLKKYIWQESSQPLEHLELIKNLLCHLELDAPTTKRRKIDPTIKAAFLHNGNAFCLANEKDFVYHWTHTLKRQINDWLIAGQSWSLCTHSAALGIPACLKLASEHKELKFYATDYSFLKINGDGVGYSDFLNDQYGWELIPNFGYQLRPVQTQ